MFYTGCIQMEGIFDQLSRIVVDGQIHGMLNMNGWMQNFSVAADLAACTWHRFVADHCI